MVVVGLVSFAGAFVVAWLNSPLPTADPNTSQVPALAGDKSETGLMNIQTGTLGLLDKTSGSMKKAMTEQQLKNLVQEVREKMREYDNRLQAIAVQEQRLQVAQNVLKEDIENLNNLRIELASTVANLKNERDKLLKSRLEITQTEQANLVTIAATYDKMDSSSASKILTSMCKAASTTEKEGSEIGKSISSFDDAVKILHYMTERPKAKLLAELATSEPALAAVLSQRLKQIVEGT
ncbi:hypothetical protein KY329_05610 [Candidatus Woesearchaeota archaeon]|nr:hypothetical protein [Candidatus Woesearchaeota archaeon]